MVKLQFGRTSVYILEIPERVSLAIGRRGPVPIVATLNKAVEIQASLVPMGGGRHRLQLNARTRAELDIQPDDRLRVALLVPEKPPRLPMPSKSPSRRFQQGNKTTSSCGLRKLFGPRLGRSALRK